MTDILGKEKVGWGWGRRTADKFNLSLVRNSGQCSVKNEHQPEKLAAAGKCPKSFCRRRTHGWGNAA